MIPKVDITLNGLPLAELGKRMISGQVVEHDGEQADELRIVVSNYDGRLKKPKRDEKVQVSLGFEETGIVKAGQFTITEVIKKGPKAVFEITGHTADLKKTLKQQKTRSWKKDKTLGDVVRQLASDAGLTPAISGALASVAIDKIIAQTNESDMHLLTRLARSYGALFKVASGNLVFVERGAGQTAGGAAAETVVVTPNDLEGEFSISDKDRPQRSKVKAHYYNRDTAKRETIESQAGSAADQSAPDHTLPQTFGSKTEAQKAVDAKKADLAAKEKKFTGTFRTGFFGAAPGGVLQSQGFGDDDDMAWTVKRRVFDFGGHGIVGQFEAEPKKAASK